MEAIARLEWRIRELNIFVTQKQAVFQILTPDTHKKVPMLPSFPTSSNFNQGYHFTTFQQTQSASLSHLTLDTHLVYTFSLAKDQKAKHHAPIVYTYVTTPPVTKAQEFHRQVVNYYVEIKNDAK